MNQSRTIVKCCQNPRTSHFLNPIHKQVSAMSILAFPRDGTSRCPFVPGQRHFPCPAVPLSQDKGRSKCPRTNSSVPARPGTKRFKNFQKKGPDFPFQNIISLFQNILSCFRTSFSVLEHPFSVLEHPFLSCFRMSFSALSYFVPCPVPDFCCPGPSCPGFWLSWPVLSLGNIQLVLLSLSP